MQRERPKQLQQSIGNKPSPPNPPGMLGTRPRRSHTEAVKRRLKKSLGRAAVPAFRGLGSASQQGSTPSPCQERSGTVRSASTLDAPLPVSIVDHAQSGQLCIRVGRVQVCKSNHVDVVLRNTEDNRKVEHHSTQVEGKAFRVGTTILHKKNVVTVICREWTATSQSRGQPKHSVLPWTKAPGSWPRRTDRRCKWRIQTPARERAWRWTQKCACVGLSRTCSNSTKGRSTCSGAKLGSSAAAAGSTTCDGVFNASEEAPAEPVDTQAEPESSESGPVQQEPVAVAQSAAAETAQHEQLGKTRDGAVDASKMAPTSHVAATSIASRTAPPAAVVRRSARISASSVAVPERRSRRPLLTTQKASLCSSSRKGTSNRLPSCSMRSTAVCRVSEKSPTRSRNGWHILGCQQPPGEAGCLGRLCT